MSRQKSISAKPRHVRRTVLIVGEGYSEVAFLKHLKSLYVERNSGVSAKINNAYGKGARNVVSVACKLSTNANYDLVAALFDTDTDWTTEVARLAEDRHITTLWVKPCFEAFLLQIHGENTVGLTTSKLKRKLKNKFGYDASDNDLYTKNFSKALIEKARDSNDLLNNLINALTSGQIP